MIYFGMNAAQHVLEAHLAEGGRAVVVDHDAIVLAQGTNRIDLVDLQRVGWTINGKIRFQVQNALAATAGAAVRVAGSTRYSRKSALSNAYHS